MIGNRLCALRENLGLKQKDIALKLGLSQTAYNRYENNKREPDIETLKLMANFFEVSTDYLIGNLATQKEPSLSPEAERLVDKVSSTDPETLAELEQYLNYLESKKNMKKIVNKT